MTAFDDYTRLSGLLLHVTYKPGWSLLPELFRSDGELKVLAIYRTIPNSQPPHDDGVILSHHEIDMTQSDAAILRAVYDALLECEEHEALEWFRVDGDAVFDPHREDVVKAKHG